MKKNIIPILMLLLAFCTTVVAKDTVVDNAVYVASTSAKAGDTFQLPICMKNSVPIRGFQFNLSLPDGVTPLVDGNGQIKSSLRKERLDGGEAFTLTSSIQSDGSILFLCGSFDGKCIPAGDDIIVNLLVKVDKNMATGNYSVSLNDIILTETDISKFYQTAEVKTTLSISANKYKLSYIVDGIEYKSFELEEGSAITPEPEPTKKGYTFSGWSEIPETMPDHDVTVTGSFTINKYTLTYMVDGEVYKSAKIEYGSEIIPEAEPTKEGYSFSGWSEIPSTMPAHDVTITGSFSKGQYQLTYMVDGQVYKTISYDYNDVITPEPEPQREGYRFSGWSEIPTSMPAQDITVTGNFTVNKYTLTYMVDGEVYKSYEIKYGEAITPEAEPTKEGYTFSGWSWIPSKMPAENVTVSGTFAINSYKLTYMIDDKIYKEVTYEYGATITPEPQPEGDYQTFEWVNLPQTMPAYDVVVYASYTTNITDTLMAPQHNARIYSLDGKPQDTLHKGLNIVRMSGGTTKKVVVK